MCLTVNLGTERGTDVVISLVSPLGSVKIAKFNAVSVYCNFVAVFSVLYVYCFRTSCPYIIARGQSTYNFMEI